MHAVAANHPARVHGVCYAVQHDVGLSAVRSDTQGGCLCRPHDVAAQFLEPREQDRLGTVLWTHQRKGVGAGYFPEVERQERPVAIAYAEDRDLHALLQHRWDDAERLQDFERARMHDGGAGRVGAFGDLVDRERLDAASPEFGGERKACRPGADDQDLRL